MAIDDDVSLNTLGDSASYSSDDSSYFSYYAGPYALGEVTFYLAMFPSGVHSLRFFLSKFYDTRTSCPCTNQSQWVEPPHRLLGSLG